MSEIPWFPATSARRDRTGSVERKVDGGRAGMVLLLCPPHLLVAYDIEGTIWLRAVVDKLAFKHRVETREVEEVLAGKPKFRFAEKGERKGEDVYVALGQTEAGRYLTVLVVHKTTKEALILSARDMAEKERTLYVRK